MTNPEAPATQRPAGAATAEKIRAALVRYRVMAWVTGVWLILLCGEVLAKYVLHVDWPLAWIPRVHGFVYPANLPPINVHGAVAWIPPVHGTFYFIYMLAAFDLAIKVRWAPGKILWVLLAGTIPVVGVVVEHFQSRNIKEQFSL